jgi:hypothetical protein
MKLTKRAMILPAASLLLLSGCGLLNTPQRNEYAAFAQAGSGYAKAVDKLLVAAGQAQVDSTSWRLIADKNDLGKVDNATYDKKTKDDTDRLAAIKSLREHARLLGVYFGHLESLATSDAPDRTKDEIQGVVKSITDLSKELNTSYPQVINALPQLTNIVVNEKIRGALREELDKRKDVVRKELQIQEALLTALKDQIAHALKLAQNIKEQEVVLAPLQIPCPPEKISCPLEKPEEWIAKRHAVVYMATTVEEVDSAIHAADDMRKAFEDLLSGEDTTGRINALIIDIESI